MKHNATYSVPWRWPQWVWESGLLLVLFLRFPVHFALSSSPPYLMDFEVFRAIAARIILGDGAHLYAPTTSELMPFKYGPSWALTLVPLGWMSQWMGAVVWASLTLLWLWLALRASQSLCQNAGLQVPPWLSIAVTLLLIRPLSAEFLTGQVNILWAALILGGLSSAISNRLWVAAFYFAAAISLKLPAVIFVAYFVAKQQWKLVVRTMILFFLINIGASVLLAPSYPLELFKQWFDVLKTSGASRAFEIGNQTLFSLTARFFWAEDPYRIHILNLPQSAVVGLALVMALTLFGLVLVVPSSRRSDPSTRTRAFGCGLVLRQAQDPERSRGTRRSRVEGLAQDSVVRRTSFAHHGTERSRSTVPRAIEKVPCFAVAKPRLFFASSKLRRSTEELRRGEPQAGPVGLHKQKSLFVFDAAMLNVLMVLCSPTAWIATYSALVLPLSLLLCGSLTLRPFDSRHGLWPWARPSASSGSRAQSRDEAKPSRWTRSGFHPTGELGGATGSARGAPLPTWRGIMSWLVVGMIALLSAMTHSGFWKALGIRYFRGESYVFLVLMILPWFSLALFGFLWVLRRRVHQGV